MRQYGKLSGIEAHTQVFNASDHRVSHVDVVAGKKPEERLPGEIGKPSVRADKLHSNQVKSLSEQLREAQAKIRALEAEKAGLTTLNIEAAKPPTGEVGNNLNDSQQSNGGKGQSKPRVTGGKA